MKKVKHRAISVVLIALCCLLGLGVYCTRYVRHGEDWVAFSSNLGLHSGTSVPGKVYDRNSVELADAGNRTYSDNYTTRLACYHLLGDFHGRTGSGVLTHLASGLGGFDLINGSYQLSTPQLQLTVDSGLNEVAYAALAGRAGSVMITNYQTGEVLCLVSTPAIDPVNPGDNLPEGVYINRAISASFTPGSVYKIITLAAALDNIPNIYDMTFTCTGDTIIEGSRLKCSGVHGTQDIKTAFANSCNCAFAQIAQMLGPETLYEYNEKFGMMESHSLSGIPTAAGNYDLHPAGSVALSWSAIGQSTDLTCPYSMLRVVSAVANGGKLIEPKLLQEEKSHAERLLDEETANTVRDFMMNNVQRTYGQSSFPGLPIGAKTGTAEVGDGTNHAWFVGFLDDPQHPYAFTVQVEHGGGGLSVAGSIANKVLQAAVKS